MIDIHTHILPGIDDGSQSVEESLQMLRAEAKQGITEVVLTPHFYAHEQSPAHFFKCRSEAWKTLKPCLTSEMPKLRLGAEVLYYEGICAMEELQEFRIQGTSLFLLEMPAGQWSERVIKDVMELNRRSDIQVLLAHIDRYLPFQPKKTWRRLFEAGVLFQVNVDFFLYWKTRFKAMSMLKQGWIHAVGSDCHSMGKRCPNWDQLPEKTMTMISDMRWFYETK